jgi:hypothetical protein
MTKQESFKRRVRARMEKTGERYAAARQALIEQADGPNNGPGVRTWISQPETSDDAVAAATGRGWDQWIDVIERWDGDGDDHAAVARYLEAEHGLHGWWAQTVTVGFERITGRRLPHQKADGTFAVSKSATVDLAADRLRSMLLDDTDRAELFPGHRTERRSKPTSKSIRIGFESGVAVIGLTSVGDGGGTGDQARTKVTVQHEKLPDLDAVDRWREYWEQWMEAVIESASG